MSYEKEKKQPAKVEEPDLSGKYTYSDYLTWQMEEMVELIKGKIFKMTPAPTSGHQRIVAKLLVEIGTYFNEKQCEFFPAPFDVILPVRNEKGEDNTVVQPDLCVICAPEKVRERGCFGAPDWIIEILSESTLKIDLQIKYQLYEETGVQEYWIVNPIDTFLEIFRLRNEKYYRVGHFIPGDFVSS